VDFWWLNNGVTIVASDIEHGGGKMLKLTDPQIVNGLQTSMEVYKKGSDGGYDRDTRSVLVKIIQAPDDAVREEIIRATNSQTSLRPSALRATDKVQRQIESYLLERGFYYERRRNYYSNRSKPSDRIVSIESMGEAVLSVNTRDLVAASPA
jgi:AIPR protein